MQAAVSPHRFRALVQCLNHVNRDSGVFHPVAGKQIMSKKVSKTKPAGQRFCGLAPTPERRFNANVSPGRARAIIDNQAKWVNGTTLNYYFIGGPNSQKAAMRKAFKAWDDIGIGLKFNEVSDLDDSQIRIAFLDDGSWSYLGRTILTIPKSEATMNIGWDISVDLDTGVHEIGHTLGMPHEHQNPFSGLVWNEDKVYASLAAPPNRWSREQTFWNIIRKIPASEVTGTSWDPDSIMHYPFEAGLILEPAQYAAGLTPAGGLSAKDIEWIRKTYPKQASALKELKPFVSESMKIESGGQLSFAFKPTETRNYTVKTFGSTDAVVVISEESAAGQQYMKGIDDSGEDHNGEIQVRLEKGKSYSLQVRVLYKVPDANAAIMVW